MKLNNPTAICVAIDADGGYAKDHKIPWHYTEDFQHFKRLTEGSICVMGKNTYLEINEKIGDTDQDSVLPGRTCFVVSTTLENVHNATVVKSINEIYTKLDNNHIGITPIFFIGGQRIFEEALGLVDSVALTIINDTHDCDTFFPVDVLQKLFIATRVTTLCDRDGNANPNLRVVYYNRK